MKVIVLGAGLLGVSTAYELAKRGFDVTVLERNKKSGMETSFSNGGQLSYSAGEPWATPGVLKKLPKWLIDPDAPLVMGLRADPAMMAWGMRFLRNCTAARTRFNSINLLRLNLYSRKKMQDIRNETGAQFDFKQTGILHFYDNENDFDGGKKQRDFQEKFGCRQTILTPQQCLEIEPCLAHTKRNIVGGIHAHMDEVGDAHKYCLELANICTEKYGVTFEYGVDITGLKTEGDQVVAVSTTNGDITADGYVMALGAYSKHILKPLGISLPTYPMKGYSLTLEPNEPIPNSSIMDCSYKVVYTKLGGRLRISGTAELAGYNTNIKPKRARTVLKAAKSALPHINWDTSIHEWACLRPSTPDGLPRLGPTPYSNLFLNTGHGTLGWTQAAASASIVADIMQNRPPEISLDGLILGR